MLMSRKESQDIYDDGFILEQKNTYNMKKRITKNMKDVSFSFCNCIKKKKQKRIIYFFNYENDVCSHLKTGKFFRMHTTYPDLLFPVSHTTCGIYREKKKQKEEKAQLIDCFINRVKHTFGRD